MARYFFNVGGPSPSADDCGVDLPDDESALEEAVRLAGALMLDDPVIALSAQDTIIEVTSGERVVGCVKFFADRLAC